MASGGSKSTATILLILNLVLYFVVTVIASWAINHGIERTHETASVLSIPARIFPIYFPVGNMATGFFVILALLAGVVGMGTSLTGLSDVSQWDEPNLLAAADSSLVTLSLTIFAMGLACKEIQHGWTDSNLRTLEVITIVVSATQLFYTVAIHAGVGSVSPRPLRPRPYGGRV